MIGRKNGLLAAALLTLFAAILQTASQNIAMFVVARILIGVGTGMSGCTGKQIVDHVLRSDSDAL